MNDNYRNSPSALAALEPLPEVTETDSDSSWLLFLSLQTRGTELFARTTPSGLDLLPEDAHGTGILAVQEVMSEARRFNRVAPLEPHWQRLCTLLQEATGRQPPPPMTAGESAGTPALVKRIRIRDQVEWADQHGQLGAVLDFFQALPEEHWLHIGR